MVIIHVLCLEIGREGRGEYKWHKIASASVKWRKKKHFMHDYSVVCTIVYVM